MEDEMEAGAVENGAASETAEPQVDAARAALVKQWTKRVHEAKEHHKKAFDRIRKSMKLAVDGANEAWTKDDENYVVPIISRHINLAVSQLYAKNPKALAKRRDRLMYQLWDGDVNSWPRLLERAMQGDVQALLTLQEIQQAKDFFAMMDRMAKTLEILHDHFMGEQQHSYKAQFKQLVRRTKVCAVGWVKLGFQREFSRNPERSARIDDMQQRLSHIERLMKEAAGGDLEKESAEAEELRTMLVDLRQEEDIIVREGLVWDFPRTLEVIVDPACRHLRTLVGARWLAHEFDMTPGEIKEIYQVDVGSKYKTHEQRGGDADAGKRVDEDGQPVKFAKVWEIQDKQNGQVLTICEGYDDFLRGPEAPDVKLERFFNLFALVFNEVESEKDLYPPSDAWILRHAQAEYNRSRQSLREHRTAARPWWVTPRGSFEDEDLEKVGHHDAHQVVQINALPEGRSVADLLQAGPTAPIDPNLYEVNQYYSDMQRSVGSQEANLGGTSGATATESSIAETSRMSTLADNVDDLDDLLTELARSAGHIMLMELSKETVMEIAGPGAVWPDMPMSREQAMKDLMLEIRAGSSGRPNQAAEVANLERAMPWIVQVPGINPEPLARKYSELLDIPLDELFVQGLPSITALNTMAGRPAEPSTGDPRTDPGQQGGQGGQNAAASDVDEPGAQPAFPTPSIVA